MGYAVFAAGWALFFGTHLFSAFRARGEGDLPSRMGAGAYKGLYSLISLAGLAGLIYGYAQIRPDAPVFYEPPVFVRHIVLALMPIALILLAAAYAPAGHIRKLTRHPMLAGIKLWAFAHVCANGDLASLLLFGSFLAYGVIDRIAQKRRPQPEISPKLLGDGIAVVAGLIAFGAIAYGLHPHLFGVSVLP